MKSKEEAEMLADYMVIFRFIFFSVIISSSDFYLNLFILKFIKVANMSKVGLQSRSVPDQSRQPNWIWHWKSDRNRGDDRVPVRQLVVGYGRTDCKIRYATLRTFQT